MCSFTTCQHSSKCIPGIVSSNRQETPIKKKLSGAVNPDVVDCRCDPLPVQSPLLSLLPPCVIMHLFSLAMNKSPPLSSLWLQNLDSAF